jgi:hypothetical protein
LFDATNYPNETQLVRRFQATPIKTRTKKKKKSLPLNSQDCVDTCYGARVACKSKSSFRCIIFFWENKLESASQFTFFLTLECSLSFTTEKILYNSQKKVFVLLSSLKWSHTVVVDLSELYHQRQTSPFWNILIPKSQDPSSSSTVSDSCCLSPSLKLTFSLQKWLPCVR